MSPEQLSSSIHWCLWEVIPEFACHLCTSSVHIRYSLTTYNTAYTVDANHRVVTLCCLGDMGGDCIHVPHTLTVIKGVFDLHLVEPTDVHSWPHVDCCSSHESFWKPWMSWDLLSSWSSLDHHVWFYIYIYIYIHTGLRCILVKDCYLHTLCNKSLYVYHKDWITQV